MRIPLRLLAPLVALPMMACGGGASPTSPPPGASNPTTPTNPTPTAPDTTPLQLTVAFVAPEAALTFYVFGATLPSGVRNPTWEIETASPSTQVVAASAGTVVALRSTSQGDSSIFVVTSERSVYEMAYDHVSAVRVRAGQTITAGTVLGNVGRLGNGRGRTELQINRKLPAPTLAFCPRAFYTAAINEQFQAAAQRVNGSPALCLTETVVP